jgi:hypothetical protein
MAKNRAQLVNPETSLWAWLAYDLRRYRIKAGLSLPAMGRIMGRSGSSLSNCEAGRRITEKEALLFRQALRHRRPLRPPPPIRASWGEKGKPLPSSGRCCDP